MSNSVRGERNVKLNCRRRLTPCRKMLVHTMRQVRRSKRRLSSRRKHFPNNSMIKMNKSKLLKIKLKHWWPRSSMDSPKLTPRDKAMWAWRMNCIQMIVQTPTQTSKNNSTTTTIQLRTTRSIVVFHRMNLGKGLYRSWGRSRRIKNVVRAFHSLICQRWILIFRWNNRKTNFSISKNYKRKLVKMSISSQSITTSPPMEYNNLNPT